MKQTPPPVLFENLVNEVLEPEMVPVVSKLKEEKMRMNEHDEAPMIPEVNEYIKRKLAHFKELAGSMNDDRNPEWESLDKCFWNLL